MEVTILGKKLINDKKYQVFGAVDGGEVSFYQQDGDTDYRVGKTYQAGKIDENKLVNYKELSDVTREMLDEKLRHVNGEPFSLSQFYDMVSRENMTYGAVTSMFRTENRYAESIGNTRFIDITAGQVDINETLVKYPEGHMKSVNALSMDDYLKSGVYVKCSPHKVLMDIENAFYKSIGKSDSLSADVICDISMESHGVTLQGYTVEEAVRSTLQEMSKGCELSGVAGMYGESEAVDFYKRHDFEINKRMMDMMQRGQIDYMPDPFEMFTGHITETENQVYAARTVYDDVVRECKAAFEDGKNWELFDNIELYEKRKTPKVKEIEVEVVPAKERKFSNGKY